MSEKAQYRIPRSMTSLLKLISVALRLATPIHQLSKFGNSFPYETNAVNAENVAKNR